MSKVRRYYNQFKEEVKKAQISMESRKGEMNMQTEAKLAFSVVGESSQLHLY